MVSAWNVGQLDQMVLPPCHYGFQVYTRELTWDERYVILKNRTNEDPLKYSRLDNGDYDSHPKEMTTKWMNEINIPTRAISLMWNQRSVDTFLGLPFNIASYGLLLEIIAKIVNMVPDELIGNLGDTHLYLNHIEQAKEQIKREPFELPKLNINTEFWPYESGECGVGAIDTTAVLNSFQNNNFCKSLLEDDIQLSIYQSHPSIKAPLSN
jgi:thymidylate synthase